MSKAEPKDQIDQSDSVPQGTDQSEKIEKSQLDRIEDQLAEIKDLLNNMRPKPRRNFK